SESRLRPYHFSYPEKSLIMEEILNKFIDEGKREHEDMRAFIYDFQTNNQLSFKETNNSLIELRFGVQELLNVINNVPIIDCDVKGVTTRGGKTTFSSWKDNGYYNGGNLPGAYIIRNQLHYQDYEWYEALKDYKLKDEALRNKAIMEGSIKEDDDKSHYE
ncbi:hypothetical protein Tco_1161569, partial [Tanacetum coccineum]